jgi:UDP-GlcNAc:undecaprenyl-phosphate GlcNAc-1-phosphate transferase
MTARVIAEAVAALALSAVLTRGAIRLAPTLGLIDSPRGWKPHRRVTPLMGGSAITLAFVLTLATFGTGWPHLALLVGGAVLLWAVGTLDDRISLSAKPRVLAEIVAATGLWAAGWGWHMGGGGALDLALTIVWVIGVVNAVNLIDLMDGVATSTVLVTLVAAGALALIDGQTVVATAALVAAGAAAGFLPHNLARPSRIFLGDGGTMPLGLICAATTLSACQSAGQPLPALIGGALLVAVPAADMGFRIVSRVYRGVSLMTPGCDSLMNRLQARVGTPRAVCAVIVSLQAVLAAVAIAVLKLGVLATPLELAVALGRSGPASAARCKLPCPRRPASWRRPRNLDRSLPDGVGTPVGRAPERLLQSLHLTRAGVLWGGTAPRRG